VSLWMYFNFTFLPPFSLFSLFSFLFSFSPSQMGSGRSSSDLRPPVPPLDTKPKKRLELLDDSENNDRTRKGKAKPRRGDEEEEGEEDRKKNLTWRTQPRGSENLVTPSKVKM
jgi:hypothetical protein